MRGGVDWLDAGRVLTQGYFVGLAWVILWLFFIA